MTGLRRRIDADLFAGLVQPFIFDHAVDERIQREILADAYIVAGVNFCSDLPHDNGTRVDILAAVHFDAAPLRIGVSTVAGASLTFFMCHDILRLYRNLLDFHAG